MNKLDLRNHAATEHDSRAVRLNTHMAGKSLKEQVEANPWPYTQCMRDAFVANPDLLISAILAKLGERTVELTAQDIQDARYMRPAMQIGSDGSVKIRNFSADSGF